MYIKQKDRCRLFSAKTYPGTYVHKYLLTYVLMYLHTDLDGLKDKKEIVEQKNRWIDK